MEVASQTRVPAVVYAAKSTEDKKGSIPTQLEDGRALAERDGLTVVAEFQDESFSAFHGSRGPGLAEAIAKCESLVAEYGNAALVVQHSDRLARGDAKSAKHLVEYVLWSIKAGVRIKSVQDGDMFPEGEYGLLMSAVGGMRNNEDSKRKSQSVKDGLRRSAERGDAAWLARGIKLDGFLVTVKINERGEKVHTAIKHPERRQIFELIWEMGLAGRSLSSIQLELSTRGYRTMPSRKDHESVPFTVNRISQVLDNPAYAGLVVHRGEIVGEGRWPRYVEPKDFWRQREQRRSNVIASLGTKRGRGAPPKNHLLAELAICGRCGGKLHAKTARKRRKDGTLGRTYTCINHYEYHPDSAEYCSRLPVDGIEVDRIVLSGIERLLTDADSLREQIEAGRRAKIEQQGKVAEDARAEAAKADAAVAKAQTRYERALSDGEDDAADIALTAVQNLRANAEKARTRMNAALDSLRSDDEPADRDVLATVWRVLSGRMEDADGDVKKLNMALREVFTAFEVRVLSTGMQVVPVISTEALARMIGTPAAFTAGRVEAVSVDAEGAQTHLWGEALRGSTSFMQPDDDSGGGGNGGGDNPQQPQGRANVVDVAEHDRPLVRGDDVELSPASAVVAVQDLKASAGEMVGCQLFAGIAELAASVVRHAAKLGAHMCRNCDVVSRKCGKRACE
jgi:DNA invertase Pin-like site-specific DNA recombinase